MSLCAQIRQIAQICLAARTGVEPSSPFHESARFRRKLAGISALPAISWNGQFAGFAQLNAV